MKLRYSTVIISVLLFVFLLDGQFFSCLPSFNSFLIESKMNDIYNRTLISLLSILLMLLVLFGGKTKSVVDTNQAGRFCYRLSLSLLVCVGIVVVYSMLTYHEDFQYIFGEMRHYFMIFLSVPILYVLITDGTIDRMMKIIIVAVVADVLVISSSVIYYFFTNTYLFDIYNHGIRFGAMFTRANFSALLPIVIFYSVKKIVYDSKLKYLGILIPGLLCVVFIDQTRARMVYIAFAIIVMVFSLKRNSKGKMVFLILFALAGIYAIYSGVLDSFFQSFSTESEYKVSTLTRLGELGYYGNRIAENPIVGMGFISDHYKDLLYIRNGPMLSFSLGDVGIVGLIAEGGLVLLIPFVIYVVRMITVYRRVSQNSENKMLLLGMIVYISISFATQSVNRQLLFIIVPVSIAIFEFEVYRFNNNQTKVLMGIEK